MLVRIGTGKEPPFFVEADERRVGVRSGNQILNERPLAGKGSCAIKPDGAGPQRFRDHVEVVVPSENVRIREMKRFLQNDLPVLPGERVMAGAKADFAQTGAVIQNLKEHVPQVVNAQHEWVGNKASGNVGDVARGKHRIANARGGRELQRGFSGVNADRPDPGLGGVG